MRITDAPAMSCDMQLDNQPLKRVVRFVPDPNYDHPYEKIQCKCSLEGDQIGEFEVGFNGEFYRVEIPPSMTFIQIYGDGRLLFHGANDFQNHERIYLRPRD